MSTQHLAWLVSVNLLDNLIGKYIRDSGVLKIEIEKLNTTKNSFSVLGKTSLGFGNLPSFRIQAFEGNLS